MEELFQSAAGVASFIAAIFGGATGLGSFISALIVGHKNKKYAAMVASNSSKDAQIEELKTMIAQLKSAIGLMMSAFTTQQLSSMALSPEVKKQIVTMADKVERLTNIKLDDVVMKAVNIMTKTDPQSISEAKKQEIIETAGKAQQVLDVVNNEAASLADSLSI